jgi:hypothetical protein
VEMGQHALEMCCNELEVGNVVHHLHSNKGVWKIEETVEEAYFYADEVDLINPSDNMSDISVHDDINVGCSISCDDFITRIGRFNLIEVKESMHQMNESHR